MSQDTTTTKTKRVPHEYFWKPKNASFTSTTALLNFLIENKVLEIRERVIECQFCPDPKPRFSSNTQKIMHIYTKHPDRLTIK